MSKELTLIQRAEVALTSAKYESQINAMVESSKDIIAVNNKDGREQAHRIGMSLSGVRIAVAKSGKSAREDATSYSKAIIAEEKRIIDLIKPEEDRIFSLRDKFDAIEQAEKDAKIKAEQERQGAIYARIAHIKAAHAACIGRSSEEISKILNRLHSVELTDDQFQEMLPQAQSAVNEQVLLVQSELTRVTKAEDDAKELEELRESARIAQEAKQARIKKAEDEAREIARLAQIESEKKLVEERNELNRQREELAKAQKLIDDERAAQDKIRAHLAAEQSRELARQKSEIAEQSAKLEKAEEVARLRERVKQEAIGDEILAAMTSELHNDIDIAMAECGIVEMNLPSHLILSRDDIIIAVCEYAGCEKFEAERHICAAFNI